MIVRPEPYFWVQMSPYHVDPKVDYPRLGQLSEEFTQVWNQLHAFYLDAVAGFSLVRSRVESDQSWWRSYLKGSELDSEEFQDKRIFTYSQIFSGEFCLSETQLATQGEVKARNSPGGTNFTTLGQLCLVSFDVFWNEYLRQEYVIAKGHLDRDESDNSDVQARLREHASHDLWGDLRLLRNSIVHNKGIATSDVARCKLIKWFKPGGSISITPEYMRAIFLALLTYRNELDNEQFPNHYIQLPLSTMRKRETP